MAKSIETVKDRYVHTWEEVMKIINRIKKTELDEDYDYIVRLQDNLEILNEASVMYDLNLEEIFDKEEDFDLVTRLIYDLNKVVSDRDTLLSLITILPLYNRIQESDKVMSRI